MSDLSERSKPGRRFSSTTEGWALSPGRRGDIGIFGMFGSVIGIGISYGICIGFGIGIGICISIGIGIAIGIAM